MWLNNSQHLHNFDFDAYAYHQCDILHNPFVQFVLHQSTQIQVFLAESRNVELVENGNQIIYVFLSKRTKKIITRANAFNTLVVSTYTLFKGLYYVEMKLSTFTQPISRINARFRTACFIPFQRKHILYASDQHIRAFPFGRDTEWRSLYAFLSFDVVCLLRKFTNSLPQSVSNF